LHKIDYTLGIPKGQERFTGKENGKALATTIRAMERNSTALIVDWAAT
jgi:hypothetical protein